MSYEVLARKWRPQVFDDVIGQGHITETLMNAIRSERLAHAYLLSGARGVGKTSVARILAKAVNCLDRQDVNPCNKCRSCLEIIHGSSVDVQEIDGASNRGIDEIRELRENVKYMPSSGNFRVYIIDEVHMLTMPAFNALLKTLEEPPPHVKFFFATTEPHKVPVTILSRCQRFDFKRIPFGLLLSQLEKIAKDEGIEITRAGLSVIVREADGSMRDAEGLLDQVASFAGTKIDVKDITNILGIIDRDIIFETSRALIEGAADTCLEIADRIYNYGYDIKEFYRALMDQFRNLTVSLITTEERLFDLTESDREQTRRLAEKAGLEKLQQSLNLLIAREGDLRFTSHPRLVLETIMIKLCRLGDVLSLDEVIKKIEALERRLKASSSSEENIPAESISDPAPGWGKRGKGEKRGREGSERASKEQTWDDLLRYIASKNQPMFSVLKDWRALHIGEAVLEISRGNNPFSSSYLDDPERLQRLSEYCRECFKRDVKIKIVNESSDKAEDPGGAGPDTSSSSDEKKADLPESVQEIINAFGGEIKGEVPLSREGLSPAEK